MKTILITHLTLLLFVIPNFGWAQLITVTGYVNNVTNGKAMENVSIFESNSKIGTITNQNGFYKLVLEKGNIELSVSDSGFKPYSQTLELKSDTTLVVELQPDLQIKDRQKKDSELSADVKVDKKSNNRKGFNLF